MLLANLLVGTILFDDYVELLFDRRYYLMI